MRTCTGSSRFSPERRLLRDVEHEQRRVSLTRIDCGSVKAWHGVKLGQPDWGEHSHSVAFTAEIAKRDAGPCDSERVLGAAGVRGAAGPGPWRRWIDTSLSSPDDIVEWKKAPSAPGRTYRVGPRSVVVLFAQTE